MGGRALEFLVDVFGSLGGEAPQFVAEVFILEPAVEGGLVDAGVTSSLTHVRRGGKDGECKDLTTGNVR